MIGNVSSLKRKANIEFAEIAGEGHEAPQISFCLLYQQLSPLPHHATHSLHHNAQQQLTKYRGPLRQEIKQSREQFTCGTRNLEAAHNNFRPGIGALPPPRHNPCTYACAPLGMASERSRLHDEDDGVERGRLPKGGKINGDLHERVSTRRYCYRSVETPLPTNEHFVERGWRWVFSCCVMWCVSPQ